MNGQLQEELRSHKYEFVVFQQGPSSQEDGRSSLIKYGGYISSLARESHATPVYFMVWPSLGYYHTFPLVIENYEKAANENDALLIPVGRSWKQIHDGIPGSGLYAQDNFHPSEKGSRLAALITYATLFGEMNLEKLKKRFLKDFNPEELRTF